MGGFLENRYAENLQDFVEAQLQPQLSFDNRYQHVHRNRYPHLGLHGVLGGAVEGLDAQVLFDPTKKQLHTPAGTVQFGDGQSGKQEIVGEKNQPQFLFGVEVMNAAQRVGIQARGFWAGQLDGLIRPQSTGAAHRTPLAPPELGVLLGARNKEGAPLGEQVEAAKVQVPAIEQVKCSGFGKQLVQKVDVVSLAPGHINIGWNAASQVQQRVQFHGAFVAAEFSPRKKRQA